MSATPMKTPRLSGAQRRAQLLDTTKAIVGERGFHAVSIDAVARRAGITRPVVYDHFDDLAGLLNALVEREGARAVSQLVELIPGSAPSWSRSSLSAKACARSSRLWPRTPLPGASS